MPHVQIDRDEPVFESGHAEGRPGSDPHRRPSPPPERMPAERAPAHDRPSAPLPVGFEEIRKRAADAVEREVEAVRAVQRVLAEFSEENLRLHGRVEAALSALARDVRRMQRRLRRLDTARS